MHRGHHGRAWRALLALLTCWALCALCLSVPARAAGAQAGGGRGEADVAKFLRSFSVFRVGADAPCVLVVGGIQGDEPGGFSAATLLATRYRVRKGTLYVVPNLNFPSIICRSRGLYGDMNRKFLRLDASDPEFDVVTRIQELIRKPEVALVLNLHDGSGYYHPEYVDKLRNPRRWGQSVIIDQARLQAQPEAMTGASPKTDATGGAGGMVPLRELERLATHVVTVVNAMALKPEHALHVHNTRTAEGDVEMEKSLSWYAVRHGKAAFGLEASKEFNVETRAFYHLAMVEAFFAQAGIEVERDFALTPQGVRTALQSHLTMAFADNRVMLPLENVRPNLNLWPMPRNSYRGIPSMPIMAVVPDRGTLNVHYGNRTVTRLVPDWRDMDDSLDGLLVTVDAHKQRVSFGQIVNVRDHFLVHGIEGYRVNAIGAVRDTADESNTTLRREDFMSDYSVDKHCTIYRVEVYKGKNFSGMFLVRFGAAATRSDRRSLPAVPRRESSLGY